MNWGLLRQIVIKSTSDFSLHFSILWRKGKRRRRIELKLNKNIELSPWNNLRISYDIIPPSTEEGEPTQIPNSNSSILCKWALFSILYTFQIPLIPRRNSSESYATVCLNILNSLNSIRPNSVLPTNYTNLNDFSYIVYILFIFTNYRGNLDYDIQLHNNASLIYRVCRMITNSWTF